MVDVIDLENLVAEQILSMKDGGDVVQSILDEIINQVMVVVSGDAHELRDEMQNVVGQGTEDDEPAAYRPMQMVEDNEDWRERNPKMACDESDIGQ